MDLVSQNLLMTSGGKKDPTYVDDVFSTYLYKGNGVGKNISNGIKLGNSNAGNSVDFANNGTLVVPTSADFKFGTGAFTIEFFIYYVLATDYVSIFDGRPVNTNGNQTTMGLFTNGQLNWWSLGANAAVIANSSSTQLTGNAWTHVAYVREGTGANEAKMYFNGSLVGTGTDNQDYAINQLCRIGGHPWSPGTSNISISNYRVIKGTALYTSNFTPPTQALTDISGTVLLCCQSSSDPFAATVTPGAITIGSQGNAANPSAQSFGPFAATDGEGGLVWIKSQTNTYNHILQDTVNGTGKFLKSNGNDAATNTNQYITSFDNSGYTLGFDNDINNGSQNFSSWSFRKAKGFFDIVTWTQSGSDGAARTLDHNLGCEPGFIMLKQTTGTENWICWHRDLGPDQALQLNSNTAAFGDNNSSVNSVSSTQFIVGADNNKVGSYVAYVFAGGASTAATARSVDFDGSGDWLTTNTSSDYNLGTGDFTLECWVKWDVISASNLIFLEHRTSGDQNDLVLYVDSNAIIFNSWSADRITTGSLSNNQWYHVALVRNSATTTMYVDGVPQGTYADTRDYDNEQMRIGVDNTGTYDFDGKISNVRLVKGTAVYTSSFNPPTEPLTNITNTKLLCCQSSTVTTATVGTVTSSGDPTASTDSPFDDPDSFKFGEEGDQNIIKCGKVTTSSSHPVVPNGAILHLPWEPQYFLFKQANANTNWILLDCMRGWTAYGFVEMLYPNTNGAEAGGNGYEELGSRTILFQGYGNNYDFLWMAIRRPDGYVGKPAEGGTEVFSMDTGTPSTTVPVYDSGHPVDFAFHRKFAQTNSWNTSARLIQDKHLVLNTNATENSDSKYDFDWNSGWFKGDGSTFNSTYLSWMFKRGQGFDVSTYIGNGSAGHTIPHSLNKTPEMIWIKSRVSVTQWCIGHIGRNGGVNPWDYFSALNGSGGDENNSIAFNDTAPTSTHFTVGGNDETANKNNFNYIAMLFASVEGISKCGYYDGGQTSITTGFQPRFLIIKRTDGSDAWWVLDTTRGWAGGNDAYLAMNETNGQWTDHDFGQPTSTGFTLTTDPYGSYNYSGHKYIYYAHA